MREKIRTKEDKRKGGWRIREERLKLDGAGCWFYTGMKDELTQKPTEDHTSTRASTGVHSCAGHLLWFVEQ